MSVAFLFPGQGSQVPGMLHNLPDHPAIARTLDEVSESLHADVRELDSAEALQSTVSVQLALLASGVAVARALFEEGVNPEAVAGLSVGAFAAAVAANALNLADGVRLVKERGEDMVKLYPQGYGLAAIVGLTERQVSALVEQAYTDQDPVYVGNINAPRQIVIAGSNQAIIKVLQAAQESGARKAVRLNVSEPSHCPLLEPVAKSLKTRMQAIHLQQPKMIYVGNVTGRALRSANEISEDLATNIAHGVRWYDSTTVLEELGCRLFLEMPPGHVLSELGREAFADVRTLAMSETSLAYVSEIVARRQRTKTDLGRVPAIGG
ncbi:MAG TPA: malonate decarboxylase subunit epsilon [Terriglobales bacterium]|jgi:malonate decarboxylase epsilon subunit|nr:malonate decarboxylase subunit epsilon [Terriglobales bacterium]